VEAGPFIMGQALPVEPVHLVKNILKGKYMDMAVLLKDNMEVDWHLQENEMGPASQVAIRC